MISHVHRCKNTIALKPEELESVWHGSVRLVLFIKTFDPHILPESETEPLPSKCIDINSKKNKCCGVSFTAEEVYSAK